MNTSIETANEAETAAAATALAARLMPGDILLLHGELGAGKSVFARALIRALSGDAALEVPSPTFTLVQYYDTQNGPLRHFDLYRLKEAEDILALGWEEGLGEEITLVEWPERLGTLAPVQYLDIRLQGVENEPEKRIITIVRV